GNYWFASSRQGILHIYENYFTDLNSCMNIDQMVNSIQPFHDRIYIGSDKGLSCYKNSERVLDDSLVNASKGLRIRQIYVDRDDAIWILSYQKGLICQSPDEKIYYINSKNSELKNDSLRCIYEREDGSFVLGTEAGIFSLQKDGTVSRLVDDSTLNSERILSVAEDEKGILYIGTDSDVLYVVEEDKIIGQITMKDGMFSNVILKIRTSENLNGIWVVTGSGICFIDENHKVSRVESVNIANSLDLIYLNQEEVAILAGNGFFRMKEEDLLSDDINYVHYDKKLGLPIDFTANANNIVKDGILYMCGINGAASLNLSKEEIHRDIWIYVKDIQSDGKNIYLGDDITSIDPKTHRLNLDFRILNYTNEDVDVRFMLEGTDKSFSSISGSESTIVSYTNLKGGDYNYYFEVLDRNSGQILAKEKLKLFKRYTFGEMPYVHLILTILGLLILALAVSMILFFRDKSLKEKYRKKYHQKHKEDLNKIAYQDIVTGVSNRNCYEKDIAEVDMKKLFAISTVSINHGEYLKRKYGMLYFEDILKNTTQILKNHAGKDVRIYRLSEYIFCIWFKKPVELEQYIIRIKEEFQELYEKEKEEEVSGLAVGAIYYEPLLHEDYESLFKRCEEMRILNQKHEEMKFMDRKIQYMNTAGIS
ncbi:MAG: diguanylate cyclase, partial [Eubacteriales bacterium]|nr:diguanylate cyclase [Eubacteriales bacterium]